MRMTPHEQARARADDLDKNLLATDERLSGAVILCHQDGSILLFDRAFVVTLRVTANDTFAIIVTEHHGAHVYDMGDLKHLRAIGPRIAIADLGD
jgi:hypothetical protein